jgi:hypothetical protein
MKSPAIKTRVFTALFTAALCLGGSLTVQAKTPNADPSRVTVTWTDPSQLSEVKDNSSYGRRNSDYWLGTLQKYAQTRADRALPAGQRLDIKFTDIKLAGSFEPWRGPRFDDVRIVKDIYPPRIDLSFTLTDANGTIIASGERKLRDMAFLSRGTPNTSDNLRYEKRLLDDWIYREFTRKDAAVAAAR